ncbi:MAG: hypothetical protein KDD56_07725 [Bdellovibrionales bacterium]|nr:hypothetical protein [Bdellovibrionales bacterium]
MATDTNKTSEINVNDRVRRTSGPSCLGVVKEIREEVTSTSGDTSEKGRMINVLWDNGTQSYFSPDAIEVVK